jgi:hypothetical protein
MYHLKALLSFVLISVSSPSVDALPVNKRRHLSKTVLHDKFPSEEATTQQKQVVLSSESQQPRIPLPQNHHRGLQQMLRSVTIVSVINVFINLFRPDPDVDLPARLPRVCWELCIGFIGICAQFGEGSILLLFLALILFPTACMDVFLWGPLFGIFTEFETCSGGWFSRRPRTCISDYTKGLGRLVASFQFCFFPRYFIQSIYYN